MTGNNGFDPNRVPEGLRNVPQWLNWRRELDDNGKPTKRQYNPRTGRLASTTAPETWSDFHTALQSWFTRKLDGIGFVLTKKMGLTFIDLDHCDNGNGEIAPWAVDVLDLMQSYAEISPSGDGLHILIFASLPDNAKHTHPMGDDGKGKIEIYDDVRYCTVTGVQLSGYREDNPLTIEPRQRELDELHAKLFPSPTKSNKGTGDTGDTGVHRLSLSDRELIDRAMAAKNGDKFARL